jgi:hypothetical protein
MYRMAARSDRGMNFFVMDDAEHLDEERTALTSPRRAKMAASSSC